MRTPNTKCSVCGNPLYRRPSEFTEGKEFCCKGCRSELYKSKPSIWQKNLNIGLGWNKGLSKKNGDDLSYGKPRSLKTRQRISKRLKEVLLKRGENRLCPICGSEFYVFPSDLEKKGRGVVCSKRCIAIMNNMNQRQSDTDIELILESWLETQQITYTKQIPLLGITIVDFFVEPNVCLYADGDYWHNLPKVKARDRWINWQLKENDYKVIRLSGSEIKAGVRPLELLH